MGDIAMNGATQLDASAATADLVATYQPRAHDASKSRRQRMRRRDLFGIDDMAQIRPFVTVDFPSTVAEGSQPGRFCRVRLHSIQPRSSRGDQMGRSRERPFFLPWWPCFLRPTRPQVGRARERPITCVTTANFKTNERY
jgi:hypothetical protein